jgi:hypothetical protein
MYIISNLRVVLTPFPILCHVFANNSKLPKARNYFLYSHGLTHSSGMEFATYGHMISHVLLNLPLGEKAHKFMAPSLRESLAQSWLEYTIGTEAMDSCNSS